MGYRSPSPPPSSPRTVVVEPPRTLAGTCRPAAQCTWRGPRPAPRAALEGVDLVVSSDLRRAHRTAAVIACRLGLGEVGLDPALRERDVGSWSGLTNDEVDLAFPGAAPRGGGRRGGRATPRSSGGILPALTAVAALGATLTVVVTHGGVIRTLEDHLGAPRRLRGVRNLDGRWLERLTEGSWRLGEAEELLEKDRP